eukprot:CAMPEP_0196789732 /NCGR_PEP_ID=MMETSP1104-20130614/27070_1 /TAXON_ID=33652 /ORGANISM="Cafeteria sp., Strain Caron Lab Isolate" /LENGTH=228 /DNA_ID=CAMNT_0042160095 /DNA_START=105 /DNA_END=793 /DNA_ORIENTATION=+
MPNREPSGSLCAHLRSQCCAQALAATLQFHALPEVGQFDHAVGADQDVASLDVSVGNALAVQVGETAHDLARVVADQLDLHPSKLLEQAGHRPPRNEFEEDGQRVLEPLGAHVAHDVGVVELSQQSDLASTALTVASELPLISNCFTAMMCPVSVLNALYTLPNVPVPSSSPRFQGIRRACVPCTTLPISAQPGSGGIDPRAGSASVPASERPEAPGRDIDVAELIAV